jgi:hypothetical protein
MPLNIFRKLLGNNRKGSDNDHKKSDDAGHKFTDSSNSTSIPPEPFVYTPLDPKIDGIRLLTLAPSPNRTSDIHCTLEQVTFAQRPEYEALSYTWGSDVVKTRIFVDGKEFGVGYNLWGALIHLRYPKEKRVLWIDAICINQTDILERNRQVRLMPHIYNRARIVNVWLGNRDTHPDSQKEKKILSDLSLGRLTGRPYWSVELLEELCLRPYWNRVWIIQEIGKAQRIRVHFDGQSSSWEEFVVALKEFVVALKGVEQTLGVCIPLKLDTHLQEKYREGYKLHSLLEGYQNALCKDPRDKIYGFIGLATDCDTNFPMDYSKSLFDVWKDVVTYRNSYQKAEQSNIIEYARLVGHLLGLFDMQRPVGLAQGGEIQGGEIVDGLTTLLEISSLNINDSNVIKIPTMVSGTISYLNPTYEEIVAVPNTVDVWRSKITKHCPKDHLPNAYEESDLFLDLLMEGLHNEDLKEIQPFNPPLEFPLMPSGLARMEIWTGAASNISYQTPSKPGPRLFLLDPGGLGFRREAAVMGLAPSVAQPGDLLCHLYHSEKAIIARKYEDTVKLVGTGVLALGCDEARSAKRAGWKTQRFSMPVNDFLPEDAFIICIDLSTLFNWIILENKSYFI